ncbi:MAG TPA: PEGA domain-containing protein [Pirellulaceae bacterium]|nr:PEGA domain-containing protein [Pirellulaceae bacterium]
MLRFLLFALVAFAAPVAAKKVEITSTPPGAEVSVDGRVIGRTPLQTSRKEIMPNWLMDGQSTRATIEIRLPMYAPYSLTVSEFGIPKKISATLEQDKSALQFENYLETVEELREKTRASERPATLYVSDDLDADSFRLQNDGYLLVGYLGASASIVPIDMIKQKSDLLGGEIILVRSSDAGVQTEMRAVKSTVSGGVSTTFGNRSTYANVNVYGSGSAGYGSAYGHGSANTRSSSVTFTPARSATAWVPYETRQYATQATFWRARKSNPAGLALDSLPPPLRATLQRNSGAFVASIEEGSRAFLSDVLVGDVVVEAAGQPVRQPSDFDDIINGHSSSTAISVVVLRDGSRVELSLIPD